MIIERNNVTVTGKPDGQPMVFIHGFGCDQSMWNKVAPAFTDTHRVVTYDLTGMGKSQLSAYDRRKFADLGGHSDDVLAIIEALQLENVILVGHSIGASIAVTAANAAPDKIDRLVLVSPTPSFLEDEAAEYHGGFRASDLEELVNFLDENHLGWSEQMAPTITGQPTGDSSTQDLTQSFCRTDPAIALHFGRVTFFSDCRSDFEAARRPALILHCDDDALVPMAVADWMRDHTPNATLQVLRATGHCPHMTVPDQVIGAIRAQIGTP